MIEHEVYLQYAAKWGLAGHFKSFHVSHCFLWIKLLENIIFFNYILTPKRNPQKQNKEKNIFMDMHNMHKISQTSLQEVDIPSCNILLCLQKMLYIEGR